MLSAINSVRFASANNYKRTYTNINQNTNQNAVGYQQSFGAAKATRATATLLGLAMAAIELINPANVAKAAVDDAAAKAAKKARKTTIEITDATSACAKGYFSDFVNATLAQTSSSSHPPLHPCLIEDALERGTKSAREHGGNNFNYGFPDAFGHSFGFDYEGGKVTSYSIGSSHGRMVNGKPTGYSGNFEQRNYKDVGGDGTFTCMEKSTFRKDGSVGTFEVWGKSKPGADAPFDTVTTFPGSLPKDKITHAQNTNPAIKEAKDGVYKFKTADNLDGNIEIKDGKIYSYEEITKTADGNYVIYKYFDANGNGAFEQMRIFYLNSDYQITGARTFLTAFDQDWIPYEKELIK